MSSKLESDVCCRLQVAPSDESYEGKRRPGRKQWQTTAGYMAWFTSWRDSLHVTCVLTACTPGSAPGPTLGNEYGKTLPLPNKRSIKMVKIKDVKNQKSRVFISLIGITSSAMCGQYYTRLLLLLHRFNCLFSRKTWVSRHQKGKTGLDLNDVYQLDHMQTVCA